MSCPLANKASPPTNPEAIRKDSPRRIETQTPRPISARCSSSARRPAAMSAIFSISAWNSGSPRTRPMDRGFAASPGISASSPRIDPIDARVLALFGLKTPDLHLYVPAWRPRSLALKEPENPARPGSRDAASAEKNRLVACLAGLAPFDDDSGKFKGPRHIQAGRAAVRKTIYMAALGRHPAQSIVMRGSSPINSDGTASPANSSSPPSCESSSSP